jgi:hypothetical protein
LLQYSAMQTITLQFPTTVELVEFATITGWQQNLVDNTSRTLSAPFGEADLELAVKGFRATVL